MSKRSSKRPATVPSKRPDPIEESFFAPLPLPDWNLVVKISSVREWVEGNGWKMYRPHPERNPRLGLNWPPPGWKTAYCPVNDSLDAIDQWFDYASGPRGVLTASEIAGIKDGSDYVHDAWLLIEHLRAIGRTSVRYTERCGPFSAHEAKVELNRLREEWASDARRTGTSGQGTRQRSKRDSHLLGRRGTASYFLAVAGPNTARTHHVACRASGRGQILLDYGRSGAGDHGNALARW
jgi:hypothetical protein